MIQGLIFDFDGLMVDTESPAYDSWAEIYREYGCELPLSRWSPVLGGSGAEFDPCAYLGEQTGQALDADALRARRWQRKLELCAGQALLPGVSDYLAAANRLGLKLGVASSSSRRWVVGHLDLSWLLPSSGLITCHPVKADPRFSERMNELARTPVRRRDVFGRIIHDYYRKAAYLSLE